VPDGPNSGAAKGVFVMAYAVHSNRYDPSGHPGHPSTVQIVSGLGLLAAIWLFVSAFVIPGSGWMAWNDIVFSILIGFFALCRTLAAYQQAWMSWISALLGVWVVLSPWLLLRSPADSMIGNNVLTGGLIIILSVWSALVTGPAESTTGAQTVAARREEVPPA